MMMNMRGLDLYHMIYYYECVCFVRLFVFVVHRSTEMKSGGDSFLDFTHTAARKYGARVLARETNRGG
jgi:hypothetical protein